MPTMKTLGFDVLHLLTNGRKYSFVVPLSTNSFNQIRFMRHRSLFIFNLE